MKVFSLFSGVGGFELGLPKDWEIVGFSEIDKWASMVLKYRFQQPRTKEEIKNDFVLTKTIVSENNYDTMEVCYVNNAKRETNFIKTTSQSVRIALGDTSLSGVKTILSKAGKWGESIMPCEDKECWICMGENVIVAEKQKNSFLPLNIKTEMDTLTEKNTELAIIINLHSKKTIQENTKYFATTVITLKGDTIYAHIKKTKPIPNFGDITKINTEDIPDFDLLTGGSPCQDLSIAGKRRGLSGTRSGLFMEYIRILRDKKPRYFIWENVKGALSSNYGFDFAVVLNEFSESGYSLWWQVLNAKDFGVPQNRERIFIIGFRERCPKEVFFEREDSGTTDDLPGQYTNTITARYEPAQATGTYVVEGELNAQKIKLVGNIYPESEHEAGNVYDADGIAPTLKVNGPRPNANNQAPKILVQNKGESQHYRLYDTDGLAPTLQSQSGMSSQKHPFVIAPNKKEIDLSKIPNRPFQLKEVRTELGKKSRREIRQKEGRDSTKRGKDDKKYVPNEEEVANCLTTSGEQIENWTFENNSVRKLMPIECERLMSWPDDWTRWGIDDKGNKVEISDSQRYKMCGNGVVSNVIRELVKNLLPNV